MRCSFRYLAYASLIFAATYAVADDAVSRSKLEAQVAEIVQNAWPADGPGGAAILVVDGDVVYRGAAGLSDLEQQVPLTADSVFRLASITKQFTAAAMLLLEERGKLSLQDSITKYLPDFPTKGHEVTIAHLLTHTSGIASYTDIPGYMQKRVRKDLTLAELIDVFKDLPPDFAPGEKFRYSNSGYVLAGAVIEKASGQSYEEFVEENIFEPLGMTSSDYGNARRIIPRRARGYARNGDSYVNAAYISMTQPHAAGSLLSTVGDLANWDAALYTDKLLSAASREKLFTSGTLNNGEETDYALGFGVGEFRGAKLISHSGGINGFNTNAMRFPDEKIYVAVLCNAMGHENGPGHVAQKIAAAALGKPFPEFKRVAVDPDVLKSYVGVYTIDDNTTRKVMFEDGKLFTQRSGSDRLEAIPHSETGFYYPNSFTHFEIVKDAAGRATGMKMYQNGADEAEVAERTSDTVPTRTAIALSTAVLDRYVGKYQLAPEFAITITRENDQLFGTPTGQPRAELFAEAEDRFFLKVVDAQVVFVSDDAGKVEKLILHQGGREMPGKKVD